MGKKWLCFCMTILFTLAVTFMITTSLPAQENKTDTEPKTETKKKSKKELKEEKKRAEEEKRRKQDEWLASLSLEELMNLEITTAGKKLERIGDVPASVVLITRADIQTYGYQSLEEILESIPGLYFTDDYSNKNIGVRGFWTISPLRNIIVLVNDIQQTEYLDNGNLLEQINIPVEAIDRIEVVRGPMSVIYGSGAFFGAINIKTNQIIEYAPVSQVSASVGSEKTYQLAVRSTVKWRNLEYAFNGSYYNTYGIDEPLNMMIDNPSLLPAFGVPMDAATGGRLENGEKYFNFSGLFKGFSFDAQYSETDKEVEDVLPSVSGGTLVVNRALRLNFGYEKRFSEKTRVKGMLTYFFNRWNFDFDFLFKNFYGTQTNGSSGYKAELTGFFDPYPKLNITLGLSYNKVMDVINEYTLPAFGLYLTHTKLADGDSMVHQALYTQFNYKLSPKLQVVAGLRLEQTPPYTIERRTGDPHFFDYTDPDWGKYTTKQVAYSHKKLECIPRLGIIYSPNNKNDLRFLYGKAINLPSFFQNLTMLDSPFMPILKPETIQTLELNYTGYLSDTLLASVSLFHNMLDHLIYRTFSALPGGGVTTYWANVGEMTTNGVELSLTFKPSKKLNLELSATYQHTIDKRPRITQGLEAAYSPNFLGYFKASYFFTEEISVAVTGNYVDKMLPYYDHTQAVPGRIGEEVDGYFLLGANFSFREMFRTGWFINLRGSNLLNQEIRYPTTSNNVNFAQKGTIGRGRTFLFTLGYRF